MIEEIQQLDEMGKDIVRQFLFNISTEVKRFSKEYQEYNDRIEEMVHKNRPKINPDSISDIDPVEFLTSTGKLIATLGDMASVGSSFQNAFNTVAKPLVDGGWFSVEDIVGHDSDEEVEDIW